MGESQIGTKWTKMVQMFKEEEEKQDKLEVCPEEEEEPDPDDIKVHSEVDDIDEKKNDTEVTLYNKSDGFSDTMDRLTLSLTFSMAWLESVCGIAPTSRAGQRIYMFTMLSIPLIPIVSLIAQNIVLLSDILDRKNGLIEIGNSVLKSDETANLISSLQQERTASLMQIYLTNTSKFTTGSVDELDLDYLAQRLQTDEALGNITEWRDFPGETMFNSKLRLQIRLDDFRELQDKRNLSSREQNEKLASDTLDFYTYTTRVLLNDLSNIITATNGSRTWRYLVTYKNILRAVESLGIEISYGIIFIGNGELSPDDYANYVESHKLTEEYMLQSQAFLSTFKSKISNIQNTERYTQYISRYNVLISPDKDVKGDLDQEIFNYFLNSFEIITMLREAVASARQNMNNLIEDEGQSVDSEYVFGTTIICALCVMSPAIVILIRNAVNALQIFSESFKSKALQLKKEKNKADNLVYQMLPKSVADNLRQDKNTSEMFDSATICFTEIDGFNVIARACAPMQLFDLLNTMYKTYDARIDNNDVYKVETINDTYMVASGLPERNGDRHAVEIANLCIELMFITPGIMILHNPSLRLKVKIGIHSGPVTAGVVGSKMPRYCLFGDTVNVASRMRTTGEPMRIQMSYETKMLLDNAGGYNSEMRGQVEVKGKGHMDTFWLVSKSF